MNNSKCRVTEDRVHKCVRVLVRVHACVWVGRVRVREFAYEYFMSRVVNVSIPILAVCGAYFGCESFHADSI